MYKKILITGGAGFIGSNLVEKLRDKYYNDVELFVFDKFLTSGADYGNIKGLDCEILTTDQELYKSIESFNIIYHLAGITDTTEKDQFKLINNNVTEFKTLLENTPSKTPIIYASSASIYGNRTQRIGFNKIEDIPNPLNCYAFTKLKMEQLHLKYRPECTTGYRFFNVFGKNDYKKGKSANLITRFGIQAAENNIIEIFKGSQTQKRDFISVDEVCKELINNAFHKEGIYNLGSGECLSLQEIIDLISTVKLAFYGKDLEVVEIEDKYGYLIQKYTRAFMLGKVHNKESKESLKQDIIKYLSYNIF